ncbi:hypothetical protein GCM10011575_19910 [Microlunatus endophyticus]|uniref:Uncharacterized protein n=1 Tax=Microlunatus endophyticus TaxID=1716077 RepID=A0A917S8J5_9ACTN|nr:hypothetical protein [Microlunatus endophyticus]GGL61402.1 hypothetical protein GCM10011575_19910 [Microlunatus endophyticus]
MSQPPTPTYTISATLSLAYPAAVEAVRTALAREGFGVLAIDALGTTHPVSATEREGESS